jgi:hypothetical protein
MEHICGFIQYRDVGGVAADRLTPSLKDIIIMGVKDAIAVNIPGARLPTISVIAKPEYIQVWVDEWEKQDVKLSSSLKSTRSTDIYCRIIISLWILVLIEK